MTDRETARSILERYEFQRAATCSGLHRVDGEYPTLLPGGDVTGRILTTPDETALDGYEGVDRGLYVRVSLPAAGGDPVETYIGNPARLGIEDSWPGSRSFPERVQQYLDASDVLVTLESA